MNEIGFKYLPIIISIILSLFIFSSKPSYSSEVPVLLAMKLECGANKAGRKPFNDYFFAITTDYTFQGNRYWNGSGKYEGDIGQKILNGSRTNKSLLIKGEGKWLKKKGKWKLQFVSKGNKSMFEHLEAGVEGYEGEGKHRRECVLKLLNQVNADDAIQLNSYIKRIAKQKDEIKKLKNQIDNLKKREKDKENNQDEINKINEEYNEKINSLENLIASLKKENEISDKKIKELNDEVIETKNNTEFKTKYEDLKKDFETVNKDLATIEKQLSKNETKYEDLKKDFETVNKDFETVNKDLATIEKQLSKNENELLAYQEKEQEEIRRKEKEEEAKRIAKRVEEEQAKEEARIKEERKQNNLKYELGSSELTVAQHLISDLEEFIKINPDEFDIVEVAELLIENRGIIDGIWNDSSSDGFDKLTKYLENSDTFNKFYNQKVEDRFNIAMATLNKEFEKLKTNQKELENELNKNLTNEFAPLIIKKVKKIRNILDDYTLRSLIETNLEIESFKEDLSKKVNEKNLELENKLTALDKIDENLNRLEILLSQNLTNNNSNLIIEKINLIKNLKTDNLDSIEIQNINFEIDEFIYSFEKEELIEQKKSDKKKSSPLDSQVVNETNNDEKKETDQSRNNTEFKENNNIKQNITESTDKENKIVFTLFDATNTHRTSESLDDFNEFKHYENIVGCEYKFKIENNTSHKVKINNFEITTINKKLFKDSLLRYKLIQIKKIIEPGENFTTGLNVGKYENLGTDWTKGGPEARAEKTKELPTESQIKNWFDKYGCEAQKGTIRIVSGVFKNNVVFPSEAGITSNEINDYVFASKGEYPIEDINFESRD